MNKLTLVQTVVVFLLVGIVACLGAFAMIASNASIKSKFTISVDNAGLKFSLTANADWANSNNEFVTVKSNTGLSNKTWVMPDIPFSTSRPVVTQSTLKIEIRNNNTTMVTPMFISLEGLAYDTLRAFSNPRFQTSVSYSINEEGFSSPKVITASEQTFRIDNITGNVETIKINIIYDLLLYNSSFELSQNIMFTIGVEEEE